MYRTIFNLLFLLLMTVPAYAESLLVGNIRLSLGSDRASVLQELRASYNLIDVKERPETVFISTGKPPNVQVIGGVEFFGEKVVWIQRNWGAFSGKTGSAEASKALFAAIENASAASGSTAVVTTRTQRVPGMEFKTMSFIFTGRKIVVSITDISPPQKEQLVSIEESIGGVK